MARLEAQGAPRRIASGVSPGALLLPVGAGLGYACGAIAIQRALGAGISGSVVNLLCNVTMALLFQVLWLLPEAVGAPSACVSGPALFVFPVFCGFLFFLGQIFTFRAIATGDISVSTPLLGSKVILVALLSVSFLGKPLPVSWWGACAMASIGIALISYIPGGAHRTMLAAVLWSLGAAAIFALTDVLVQLWVPGVGYKRFAPVMFGMMGVLSVCYLPGLFRRGVKSETKISSHALPWLFFGAILLSIQSLAMYSAIGLYGNATLTNILYGSRCLWSVLLVWMAGALLSDGAPMETRTPVMLRRLAGAILLLSAMTLVLC